VPDARGDFDDFRVVLPDEMRFGDAFCRVVQRHPGIANHHKEIICLVLVAVPCFDDTRVEYRIIYLAGRGIEYVVISPTAVVEKSVNRFLLTYKILT